MIESDQRYLRYAMMVASRAREHGDQPFGAILVSNRGRILLEAENSEEMSHDCTSHAETKLLAEASKRYPRHLLNHSTLYVNAEPCPMCAGAIFWSGVSRVVFGLSSSRLRQLVGERAEFLHERCSELLAKGSHRVEVVGPMIEDEAAEVFVENKAAPRVMAR